MDPTLYKSIVPDTSPELLFWRNRTGADYRDEVWDGIYHVVSEKSAKQKSLEDDLESWLHSNWVSLNGKRVFRDTRLVAGQDWELNYRVPAFCLYVDFPPEGYVDHHLTAAPDVVVEVISEEEVSDEKIEFYRRLGVKEIWVIDSATGHCRIIGCENGRILPTVSSENGPIVSPVTGIGLTNVGSELILSKANEIDFQSARIRPRKPR